MFSKCLLAALALIVVHSMKKGQLVQGLVIPFAGVHVQESRGGAPVW